MPSGGISEFPPEVQALVFKEDLQRLPALTTTTTHGSIACFISGSPLFPWKK
jgi:hypothetical protein